MSFRSRRCRRHSKQGRRAGRSRGAPMTHQLAPEDTVAAAHVALHTYPYRLGVRRVRIEDGERVDGLLGIRQAAIICHRQVHVPTGDGSVVAVEVELRDTVATSSSQAVISGRTLKTAELPQHKVETADRRTGLRGRGVAILVSSRPEPIPQHCCSHRRPQDYRHEIVLRVSLAPVVAQRNVDQGVQYLALLARKVERLQTVAV